MTLEEDQNVGTSAVLRLLQRKHTPSIFWPALQTLCLFNNGSLVNMAAPKLCKQLADCVTHRVRVNHPIQTIVLFECVGNMVLANLPEIDRPQWDGLLRLVVQDDYDPWE